MTVPGNLSLKTGMMSILIMLLSCCSEGGNSSELSKPATARSVEVYRVKREEIRQGLEGYGNLSFRRKADITSAVDGTIRDLMVEEGDEVTAGQPIAELYNIQLEIRKDQAQTGVFSAEAAYELAGTQYREGRLRIESSLISIDKSALNLQQKNLELEHQLQLLENQRELFQIGGTTEEELASMELSCSALETGIKVLEKDILIKRIGFRDSDISDCGFLVPQDLEERRKLLIDINSMTLKSEKKAAEARLRSAGTELRSAEALLNETKLRSPMTGVIGARYKEKGERLQAEDRLFTVFDSSEIDLIFSVPEEVGVLLRNGQPVELSLDAVPDRNYSALIRYISPTVDTGSGNITVKAGLGNSEGLFRPGMFSRFSLNYGASREVLRVPSTSLLRLDGSRGIVFSVRNGRVYPQNITVGEESSGMNEILSGLTEGDVVVIDPSPLLKEGDPVDVR